MTLITSRKLWWLRLVIASLWLGTVNAASSPIQGAKSFELPDWFKSSFLDIGEDVQEATAANKRVLLFFEQSGCPYCAHFMRVNLSIPAVRAYAQKHFAVIDINLWGDREVSGATSLGVAKPTPEKLFSAQLDVWATPTLLFLDEYGVVVLRLNGYYEPDKFMLAMRYVAEKQETKMSMSEFFALAQQQPQGKLIPQKFFASPPYDLRSRIIKKPLMVLFEEPGSEGSNRLHQEVLQDPATLAQLRAFHVVQLNSHSDIPLVLPDGSKQSAKAWVKTLRLNTFPTVLLFAEGQEILRLDAMFKAFHFQALLNYVASDAYRKEPNVQRYLQKRTKDLQEQGVQVDLWH